VNLRLEGIDLTDVNEMDFTEAEDEALSVRAGDILLVEGGNRDAVGAPTWVDESPEPRLYIQNTIVRLRVLDSFGVLPRFLYWIWRAKFAAGHFESVAVGTKLYHLGPQRVADVLLPVPDRETQSRWCDRLDRMIGCQRALRRQSTATARLRSTLLNDLLEGLNV